MLLGFIKLYSRFALFTAIVVSGILSHFSDQWIDPYYVQVLTLAAIYATLAVSLNLVMGETGQFSLCHAAFMAVGAYTSACMTSYWLPSWFPALKFTGTSFWSQVTFFPVLITGGLTAGLTGWIVGVPSLRLRGDYLALVTLGFGEIIRVVLQNTETVGGARGMEAIVPATNLFWSISVAATVIYFSFSLVRSTYGKGFHAVRDDELAAESMGVNTTIYKVTAFVWGAFFSGMAGALYAHSVEFISPDGFTYLKSIEILVMVVLGGMGQIGGVTIAAIFLTLLNEWLRQLGSYRMVAYSLIIIFLMILRPQGLLGGGVGKGFRPFIRKKSA